MKVMYRSMSAGIVWLYYIYLTFTIGVVSNAASPYFLRSSKLIMEVNHFETK